MKQVYRIEVQAPGAIGKFKHWIGADLKLVLRKDLAVACTHEEHLQVMESINAPAVAYREELTPGEEGELAAQADAEEECEDCDELLCDCTCGEIDETVLETALCEASHDSEFEQALAQHTGIDDLTIDRCRSFEDAGILTMNKGVVITFKNGAGESFTFQLTIVQDNRR